LPSIEHKLLPSFAGHFDASSLMLFELHDVIVYYSWIPGTETSELTVVVVYLFQRGVVWQRIVTWSIALYIYTSSWCHRSTLQLLYSFKHSAGGEKKIFCCTPSWTLSPGAQHCSWFHDVDAQLIVPVCYISSSFFIFVSTYKPGLLNYLWPLMIWSVSDFYCQWRNGLH
jgi:hypothetical protein